MICKKCEQSYSDALATCPYCGAPKEPVEENAKQQEPQANTQQAYQQPAAPQGQPQYGQAPPQGETQYQQAQQQYGQPQYQQQPQYTAPPQGSMQENKGKGTASMVCGILGLIFCWVPFLGLILTIVAVSLYASSRKDGPSGMATAGLVCGIIGMIVAIIVTIVSIVALAFVGTIGAATMSVIPFM